MISVRQRRRATTHRLVLLALLLPIVALIVVFWLLLPGGIASMSYTPSQFSQAVQVQPYQWRGRQVAVAGYLTRGCVAPAHGRPAQAASDCTRWLMVDRPAGSAISMKQAASLGALQVLPQQESSWHALFRRLIPGLAVPFPRGAHPGAHLTITGTVQVTSARAGVPIFVPKAL